MTVTIRRRGALTQRMRAEYLCPEHGRFEALVVRIDNGDPPLVEPCPTVLFHVEGELSPAHCNKPSDQVTSAPMGRMKRGEVTRGKSDERPPWALNTEPLADGMTHQEWAKPIDQKEWDERRETARGKMGID